MPELLPRRLLALLLVLTPWPLPGAERAAPYASAHIAGVVFQRQLPDFGGEACAAMWLHKLGYRADQDYVFDQSGLDPMAARGCRPEELAAALRKIGFDVGPGLFSIVPADTELGFEAQFRALHADLVAGVPSIVTLRVDARPDAPGLFRLVLGYDAVRDEVLYHDPALADGANRRLPRTDFLALWTQQKGEAWTLVRLRLAAARLPPAIAAASTFTAADYAQHMMELSKKRPQGFSVFIEPPFVVLGDESPRAVQRRAEDTVRWAVRLLKKAYFSQDPAEILDIWLFRDEDSYQKHCLSLFGDKPSTPYGFYSHPHRALVMNIATGGGTLVHEIVHPFMAANFPECPAWLNEGLGSLYEQCNEVDGRIHGLTNWRLAGLQRAIREKRVPPLEQLCTTSTDAFYEDRPGVHYAQARYLCYYLQEQDLLEKFYHAFHANYRRDAFGWKTLKTVLGRDDMQAFQREWEQFVLGLRFP